jgi:hypothetical protein
MLTELVRRKCARTGQSQCLVTSWCGVAQRPHAPCRHSVTVLLSMAPLCSKIRICSTLRSASRMAMPSVMISATLRRRSLIFPVSLRTPTAGLESMISRRLARAPPHNQYAKARGWYARRESSGCKRRAAASGGSVAANASAHRRGAGRRRTRRPCRLQVSGPALNSTRPAPGRRRWHSNYANRL